MDASYLKNFDDDKRDVILLVYCNRLPPLEFGEHSTRQLGGGLRLVIAYDAFQLLVAKCLSRRVFGFANSVGIEQDAIGWCKR
jgi:hypothetical protein